MAATSIFFNGRLIRQPGSYSEVDATGLEGVGLDSAGIVALVGASVGGRPAGTVVQAVDIPRFRSPEAAQSFARSGDLREAAAMAFSPSNDSAIQGGAAEVVLLKVNPALQAAATFANANGDSLIITAADWGEFTNQIRVLIQAGTVQGKLVTASFEGVVESVDDIGGDTMFTLLYRPSSGDGGVGWDTMTVDVLASGLRADATSDTSGADGDVLLSETGAFTVESDNAADVTQTIVVVGVDGGGPVVRSAQLNGTTPVSLGSFDGGVFGAFLDVPAAGTVDVNQTGTNLTVAAAAVDTGGEKYGAAFVANSAVTVVADAAATADVYVVGRSAVGSRIVEAITLNGTTPVAGSASFSEVEAVVTGAVPAVRTVTVSATAAQTSNGSQDTLQKVADFFNARQRPNSGTPTEPFGFNFTLVTGLTTLDPVDLDLTATPVDVDLPVTGSFFADLFFLEQVIDSQFSLINAARASGAVGVPDDTPSAVFLTGGGEGTTTFADWQGALNLLKKIRVSTIVPLTPDPAVHAALSAHCEFMAGVGRNERDGIVGAQNVALTGPPTLAEIASQITSLNTRHLRLCGQNVERFNVDGERTVFPPHFQAVVAAGMQAGSPVGVSLTHKKGNVLSVSQDMSWNPIDDAETLIERGLLFMEDVESVGRRFVRNVTTDVSSTNIAFTEASVNEAVNFAVFNFRTNLELAVGRQGFSGTVNATKSVGQNTLGLLVDTGVLTSYRNLDVSLLLDVLDVSVEIAPVIPVNFVRSVLHLVNQVLRAA